MGDVGFYELLESGLARDQIMLELVSRAVARMGLRSAIVDPAFPLAVADRLRADGIILTPDHDTFAGRRRAKSPAELAGIRRAQKAAEAGMAAAAAVLRAAVPEGDKIVIDGKPVTAEQVRSALREACTAHGAPAPPDIIVASVWQGFGHEAGFGPLPANLPIHIDLWPRDEETGCWADMARTFVVGEPDARTLELDALAREAHLAARDAIRPGVTGRELHALACDIFEAAGHKRCAPARAMTPTRAFSSPSAMASASRSTRTPAWARQAARRWSPATSSPSSPASGIATSARWAPRTSSSSPRTATRSSPTTPMT